MNKEIHRHYIIASNLILLTVVLGVFNMFFSSELFTGALYISIGIGTLLFVSLLAYIVRQGKRWIKYFLLVLTIGGFIFDPNLLDTLVPNSIPKIIYLLQSLMQLAAVVLLFRIPKSRELVANHSASDNIIDEEL